MTKVHRLFLLGSLLIYHAFFSLAFAENIKPAKAAICQACHGVDGYSPIPSYPHLAGQHKKYLIDALYAYRDGRRKSSEMNAILIGLTDSDIVALAEYYSQL